MARAYVLSLASLALVAWAWSAGRATAETPLDLEWLAPPPCPDVAYVRAGVAGLLAGSSETGSRVGAVARVTSTAGEWSLDLTITRDGNVAHRTMKAASCPAVADAAALILALTIDPVHASLQARAPSSSPPDGGPLDAAHPPGVASALPLPLPPPLPLPAPAPPPPAPPPAPPPRAPPPRAPPSAAPRARLEVGIKASADADLGSIPGPALGIEGGLSLLYGRVRLEGFGAYWPGETATAAISGAQGSLRATVHLAEGGFLGCYLALKTARWELGPCLGLELGSLSGSALLPPTASPTSASTLWSAARGDVRLSLRVVRRFALVLGVGVAVPLSRSPFDVAGPLGPVQVFEPGAVAGRASLGPEVRF
jgi:hypothetical protein